MNSNMNVTHKLVMLKKWKMKLDDDYVEVEDDDDNDDNDDGGDKIDDEGWWNRTSRWRNNIYIL